MVRKLSAKALSSEMYKSHPFVDNLSSTLNFTYLYLYDFCELS